MSFIPPLIPTLVDHPPEGDGWIHEVKFDGYRAQFIVDRGEARVFTRNGHDWSTKFWPIALAGLALPCKSAIIDGEVIVCNEEGASGAHRGRTEPSVLRRLRSPAPGRPRSAS